MQDDTSSFSQLKIIIDLYMKTRERFFSTEFSYLFVLLENKQVDLKFDSYIRKVVAWTVE